MARLLVPVDDPSEGEQQRQRRSHQRRQHDALREGRVVVVVAAGVVLAVVAETTVAARVVERHFYKILALQWVLGNVNAQANSAPGGAI